ncbi:MAG: ROK family protein [Candidatus Eremiobacteraeota bacterium]|nr:ROK family protein [Candidatus Eremiobacteraeota bacterium]
MPDFRLGDIRSEREFKPFSPPPREQQLQHSARSQAEQKAARERVECIAETILECRARLPDTQVLLAVAAPGLKNEARDSIVVSVNGPRITGLPSLLEELTGLSCGPLGDDSVMAALAEQVAPGGQLRDVSNAYYVGPGTGLAEAVLQSGRWLSSGTYSRAWELGLEAGLRAQAWVSDPHGSRQRLLGLIELRLDEFTLQRVVLGQRLSHQDEVAGWLSSQLSCPVVCSSLVGAAAIGAAHSLGRTLSA